MDMKKFLLTLIVVLTTCTLAIAQHSEPAAYHPANNADSTAITVIGTDTASSDDSVEAESEPDIADRTDTAASNSRHESVFSILQGTIDSGMLLGLVAIISVFGFPVFILFIIFFFRYKNRKARYRLAEQALAAGQPLPAEFINEGKYLDQRSQGIKNTFTGIGLFIFLWAITDEFGIGAVGLLIAFMGIGQWIIGRNQLQDKPGEGKNEAER